MSSPGARDPTLQRRKSLPFSTVAGVMLTLAALAAAGVVVTYFVLIRHEPVAVRHLPPDTVFAVRLDVQQAMLYEPVRRHLFPLVLEAMGDSSGMSRFERFEEATGLRRRDVRELVMARGKSWADWVVVVAGRFPDEGVVTALSELLRKEGFSRWKGGGDVLEHRPTGVAIGQAEDSAMLIAASVDVLRSALPSTDAYERVGLASDAAGSMVLTEQALRSLATNPAVALAPGLGALRSVARARGVLALEQSARAEIILEPRPGVSGPVLEAEVIGLLDALRVLVALSPGKNYAGEQAVLSRTEVTRADQNVQISVTWQREEIERGARSLAGAVRRWLDDSRAARGAR